MKNLLRQSILIATLAMFGWSIVANAQQYEVQQLFSEDWSTTGYFTELSAIAYDAGSDNLFFIKSIHNVPNNEVHRYNFSTTQIATVYSYPSQWDYGMRAIGGDLYVVKTYDNSILRLTNLSANTLTKVNIYPDSTGFNSSLVEIGDISLVNGNIYFVCGNMLTSNQHNGIQYLQGPNFTTVNELLSSNNAGWPDPQYGYSRSIISIGSGASSKFAIATGSNGNIELCDISGNLMQSETSYGDSYLQKDSQDRIYAITGSGTNTKIIRWSSSLDNKEEFLLNFSQYNGGNGIRFILKESGSNIDVIMAQYRASSPVFYKTTIPTTSSINQIDNSEIFSVYPNPTTGEFMINYSSKQRVIKISLEIYNVMGEKVLQQQNTNEIDLSNSPKGIYFVRIYDGAKIYNQKIVVQ